MTTRNSKTRGSKFERMKLEKTAQFRVTGKSSQIEH